MCLVLSIVWPFIPVPEPDPFDVEEIPPRIAQLLLEEKPLPPPPPPVGGRARARARAETGAGAGRGGTRAGTRAEPSRSRIARKIAREQAQAALMPFAEDLADLVDKELLDKVADDRDLSASVGEAERNERSMITSKVGTASGGINTAA